MSNLQTASVKQEIAERVVPGTSQKPIEINEDEESSDGENSVIILDSDTEPEDAGADDEEAADEEDSDEEDEDEDEEESDEDSDSSVDSESVNSVWSTVDVAVGGDKITTEAAEVNIVKKFEKAMYLLADNNSEKGQKLLEKILDDPLISTYRLEHLDYETLEEPPRLARMLQVFIAVHKNLAKLDPDNQVAHLCQVLGYEPNNTALWFDAAMKSVDNGDLDFAKFAFKKCESLKESLEAHATVLYLTCDYAGCLKVLKTYMEETDSLNDKMKYLKFKIRTTSEYYKHLSDRIFEEDEVYADINALDQRKIIVFDERIEEFRKKTDVKRVEIVEEFGKEQAMLSVIPITISAEQDLTTVCTIFCDLFDRIHNYSHSRHQLVEITLWESRKDFLEVADAVAELVDIVECVEEMTEKVDEEKKKKKKMTKTQKQEYKANWRKRLFVEKNNEDVESGQNTADEDGGDEDEMSQDEGNEVPENELASTFGLVCGDIDPIQAGGRQREKTPPPSSPQEFIDSDNVLSLLEAKFSFGTHTILELLEETLLLLMEHTPALGALPQSMKEVVREMYNRLGLLYPMNLQKYNKLNVAVMELDCQKATEECIKKYISPFHHPEDKNEPDDEKLSEEDVRALVLRFTWKYANTGLKDETKLEYLYSLTECMRAEEVVPTTSGSFATWDVELAIADLEKKKRIESVKHLWKSRNYKDLVEIITKDIEFGSISNEETLEMLTYWLQSLEKLKMFQELASLAVRALHFYLFTEFSLNSPSKLENLIDSLLMKLQRVDFKKVDTTTSSTVGYLVCAVMKKYKKAEKEWKNWKILYEIVKSSRPDPLEYIESLDKNMEPHAMPLIEMDLLVKAHEVLGEYHCCAQKNYEFLFFFIDRIRELVDDIPALEACYLKDNGYLWNNVNDEIAQILFCMFGKYGKRRKADDHENGGSCSTTLETARRVLHIILVQPLPLYDEKEKLLHDINELLNSKFPCMLRISAERQKKLDEFIAVLRAANSREDINNGLKKCRDDVDDYIQSLVWYTMALIAYRMQNHKDAAKYSGLYLLTEESVHDDRLRGSVWGVLAHENVHDLFQLDLHEIYEQWKWRIMPFRMAVDAQEHEPVPHFELAAIIYQLSSSLARFHRNLDKTDPRKKDSGDVGKLRIEAREQFDRSLELTKLGDDGSQPEHQWLCYFFIGKLEAKNGKWDIVKVVESFYEAACGCELAGFYYPQKVQTKKQQNFEPLEVHYQAHAAVFKYLMNNDTPPIEVLRKLLVLMKVMNNGHKVVKPNNSLFKVSPDVYTVVESLVFETARAENKEKPEVDIRSEIISELKDYCYKAFVLVTERFPHIKSYFRLAQIAEQKGNLENASEHIFKNVFKRKKKDDAIFENVVEISCNDINRNGSFNFHIERCLKLGLRVAQKLLDLHNVVAVLLAMITAIVKDDEDHVSKEVWKTIVCLGLKAMENISEESKKHVSARNTPSPALGESSRRVLHITTHTLRVELWKLLSAISKGSKGKEELIVLMKTKTEALIAEHFQSVDSFRVKMTASKEDGSVKKKYMTQKRRLEQQAQQDVTQQIKLFAPSAPPVLTPQKLSSNSITAAFAAAAAQAATASTSGPYQPLSDSDDDIQCLDPPPAKKPAPTLPQRQLNASAPVLIAQATVPPKVPVRPIVAPVRTVIPPMANKAVPNPVVAPKPIIAPKPVISRPIIVPKPIPKPTVAPKPVPKPAPKPASAPAAAVNPIAALAAAANAGGANPMAALLTAAMSADPAQQRMAAEAIKTLQAQQMRIQNAQLQALAAAAVQMQAQAAQNQNTAIARPTPVRPAATAVVGRQAAAPRVSLPSTSAAVNPSQQPRQSLPHRPPANTVRPPFTQNTTQRAQPTVPVRPIPTRPSVPPAPTASMPNSLIRPNAVRPTAPQASRPLQNAPHNIARPTATRPQANAQPGPNGQSAEGRANVLQFLNSITDPVERNRMMRLLLQ